MSSGEACALLFRVDLRLCALPLEAVIETMRALPIEPVAGAPACVLGLSVIRGAPTVVVDARQLLGGTGSAARFITVRIERRVVALAVDEVVGLSNVPRSAQHDAPPLLRDSAAGALDAVAVLDRELLFVLESIRLVSEEGLP